MSMISHSEVCLQSVVVGSLAILVFTIAPALATGPVEIPEKFRRAPAIVLEDTHSWHINPPRNADVSVRERILVLDPRRFTDAYRAIYYDREGSKLDYLNARTVLPGGETIEVPDELKNDVVLLGTEGVELRSFQFVFPSVQPGSILEMEYRIHEGEPVAAQVWEPQRTIPVLESRYNVTLRQPTYVQRMYIESVVRGEESDACTIDKVKDGVRASKLSIVCRNLPAFEPEPQAPPEADLLLRFDLMWSHGGVQRVWWGRQSRLWSLWIGAFIRDRPGCKALAAEITADAQDDREKLDLIYDWIKRNLEFGAAPPFPIPAAPTMRFASVDEVLEERRGNPTEITLLAFALLRESGLRANPILVADRTYGRFNYAALDPVHHLMLEVEVNGQSTLLDASCRYCQPGITDWRYASPEGAAGIRVFSGDPLTLGIVPAKYNVENRAEHVEIAEDGTARVEGKVVWRGQFAIDLRRRWEHSSDVARREDFLGNLSGDFEDVRVEFSDPADVFQDLTADYSYRTCIGVTADGRLMIRPIDVFSGQLEIPIQEERRQPLWFPFPFSVGAKVLFELPDGYEVELPVERETILGPGMTFVSDWEYEHDVLAWTGGMSVDRVEIDPEKYEDAREFVRRLRHRLSGGLVARRVAP